MNAPSQLDLTSLARALARDRRHPGLVKNIRQVESVASAHEDLRAAKEALEELKLFTTSRRADEIDPARAGVLAGALFAHAIVLYTRATDTKPIDRWKWFGRDMLSEEHRLWHKEVMAYRDTVLTHFGHGSGHEDGPTITHALVMRRVAPDSRELAMTFVQNRANTRASLSTRLAALTDACLDLARARFDARLEELLDELRTASQSDPDMGADVRAHSFDSSTFIDNAEVDLDHLGEGAHYWLKRAV
jgi:hypothetical protein